MKHITNTRELEPGRYKITNIKAGRACWWYFGIMAFENNKNYIYNPSAGICALLESFTPEEQNMIKKISGSDNLGYYYLNKFNSKLYWAWGDQLREIIPDEDFWENSYSKLEDIGIKITKKFINSDELIVYIDIFEVDGDDTKNIIFDNFKYILMDPDVEFDIIKELPNEESIIEDFIYKIDESDKFCVETEYDSLLDYFNAPFENDYKQDTVTIKTRKEKMPLIKFSRTENNELIFLVDITTKDRREFRTKAYIKTKEELNKLLQETIDMLNDSDELCVYANDLSDFV